MNFIDNQSMVTGIVLTVCFFLVLAGVHSIDKMVKDYDWYWEYVEEAVGKVLGRHEDWPLQ